VGPVPQVPAGLLFGFWVIARSERRFAYLPLGKVKSQKRLNRFLPPLSSPIHRLQHWTNRRVAGIGLTAKGGPLLKYSAQVTQPAFPWFGEFFLNRFTVQCL